MKKHISFILIPILILSSCSNAYNKRSIDAIMGSEIVLPKDKMVIKDCVLFVNRASISQYKIVKFYENYDCGPCLANNISHILFK